MKSFWNNESELRDLSGQLAKLVPATGPVSNPRKNRALEKFRRAANCYYDLYNNGLCNRASEFRTIFGISSSHYRNPSRLAGFSFRPEIYSLVEEKMNEIVIAAAKEQNIL